MLMKGQLYITNDINMVMNSLQNFKIFNIGQKDPQLEQIGVIWGGLYLPPYEASVAELNGDINSFILLYSNYLLDNEPQRLTAAIIKALLSGINILLYITKDESELMYSKILCQSFTNLYGIVVGTPQYPFSYDIRYDAVVLNLLYLNEFITVDELMLNYPSGTGFDQMVIGKLLNDFPPSIQLGNNFEEFAKYYYDYKENIKSRGKFLTPLLTFER